MVLVPRQTQMTGTTGDVPYYGGRLTPAQAYAAGHPRPRPVDRTAEREARLRRLLDLGMISQEEHDELERRFAG